MSFEYRELGTQVFLNGDKGDKSPCGQASCGKKTKKDDKDDDDDCCANTCGTTTLDNQTDNCPGKERDTRQAAEYREGLSLLRQHLQDTLAAG